MTYTPDREINPPCCYEVDVDTAECVLCKDEFNVTEVQEIGGSMEYLCDWCVRIVAKMDDDEVDEFVDENLDGKDILKKVIKDSNNEQ